MTISIDWIAPDSFGTLPPFTCWKNGGISDAAAAVAMPIACVHKWPL
jgi:hypothetical protein